MRIFSFLLLIYFGALSVVQAAEFDHEHTQWNELLNAHVYWKGESASELDYAALKKERAKLERYTATLSAVSQSDFDTWEKPQQLAFLINAYNAFTVDLVLSKYPKLESIKDIGGWFGSPWKQDFFSLLGERRHLDAVEHDLIRGSGRYDEPRIHVAVVCASVGCPALRAEAYVAEQLEQQLGDSLRRFLSDTSRNNFQNGTLTVSKIFDWYGEDFPDLKRVFSEHAEQLAHTAADVEQLKQGDYRLDYSDYDWSLNDRR